VYVKKGQDFNFRKDIIDVMHPPFLLFINRYNLHRSKGGTSFRQKKKKKYH